MSMQKNRAPDFAAGPMKLRMFVSVKEYAWPGSDWWLPQNAAASLVTPRARLSTPRRHHCGTLARHSAFRLVCSTLKFAIGRSRSRKQSGRRDVCSALLSRGIIGIAHYLFTWCQQARALRAASKRQGASPSFLVASVAVWKDFPQRASLGTRRRAPPRELARWAGGWPACIESASCNWRRPSIAGRLQGRS
jgi:hypothetical protein